MALKYFNLNRGSIVARPEINPLSDFGVLYDAAMWADDPNIRLGDGDPIASWPMNGTYTNPLVQGTGAAQPIFDANNSNFNNKACLYFDGTDDHLVTSAWASASGTSLIVTVMRVHTLGTAGYFWDNYALTDRNYMRKSSGNAIIYGGVGGSRNAPKVIDTDTHIITLWQTLTSGSSYTEDGATIDTANAGTANLRGVTLAAAANQTAPAAIEVAFWASIPAIFWLFGSSEDLAALEALQVWLADYYGITLS